jgi:type IV pilus assembly protein PilB
VASPRVQRVAGRIAQRIEGSVGMKLRKDKQPATARSVDVQLPSGTGVEPGAYNNAAVDDFTIKPGGARLGEMLVDANLLTEKQLLDSLELVRSQGGGLLGRVLVEMGLLDERELARVLAEQRSLEVIDLRQTVPDSAATELLTEVTARRLLAIPVSTGEHGVLVAVADPTDEVLAELEAATSKPVQLAVAAQSDILRAIVNSYRVLQAIGTQVEAFEAKDSLRKIVVESGSEGASDFAPVVQVVQLLIKQALRDRASDIHLEPQIDHVRVRYRIDGALHDAMTLPGAMGPAIVSRIKILGNMNIVERRRPQDGQISMEIEGRAVDIRVSSLATIRGEKVVLRLLDKRRPLFKLGDLGMSARTVTRYEALLKSPYGMMICAGPTGSGKTTTLYGSLGEINTPERNITTIEDPVEYVLPLINQIQINEQAGITFAGGLKSILRQDPDVVLVGEIRDVETARIAVQSALTGHLVLSSLHATDSVSALHRLLDMGIESFLVASSVTAVVAQRLMRRLCTHCRTLSEPTAHELAYMHSMGGEPPETGFVHATGCNFCAHTGYLERIGVYELLTVSEGIRGLISSGGSYDDLRKLARAEGMLTLQEEALTLVQTGVTTIAEVLRSIYVVGA